MLGMCQAAMWEEGFSTKADRHWIHVLNLETTVLNVEMSRKNLGGQINVKQGNKESYYVVMVLE